MNSEKAKSLGLKASFRIVHYAQAALAPEEFPIAPVSAIRNLAQKTQISLSDIDRFEINEAFAVVAEGAIRQLELNPEKVNARGGSIALGHPIGASGVRILITLMHQLEDEHLNRGIAAICLGGGEAIALMIEKI
jgi:acetyl-CoA C-acetyltransferase